MAQEERSRHSRWWETFLLRDLTYIGGGLLTLLGVIRVVGINVAVTIYSILGSLGGILLLLIVAFITGIVVQKGMAMIGVLRTRTSLAPDHKAWAGTRVLLAQVGQKFGDGLTWDFEEALLKAQAAANIGACALVSAVTWLISLVARVTSRGEIDTNALVYIVLAVFLFVGYLICVRENVYRRKQAAAILEELKRLNV